MNGVSTMINRLHHEVFLAAGQYDAFYFAWWSSDGDTARIQSQLNMVRQQPLKPPTDLNIFVTHLNKDLYHQAYVMGLTEALARIAQHTPISTQPATKIPPALRRATWLSQGRKDAFCFVLAAPYDRARLQAEIDLTVERITDQGALRGAMAPGAGPRIYQDGYLAGLKDALQILLQAEAREPQLALVAEPRANDYDATTGDATQADGAA